MLFHEGLSLDVMGCYAMSAGILGPVIFLTLYIHTSISHLIWRNLLKSCTIRGDLSFSFQQSSVLTHTASNSMRCDYNVFENRIISKEMCSPRSLDLDLRRQFLRVGLVSG
jgi:hypothetical protein